MLPPLVIEAIITYHETVDFSIKRLQRVIIDTLWHWLVSIKAVKKKAIVLH